MYLMVHIQFGQQGYVVKFVLYQLDFYIQVYSMYGKITLYPFYLNVDCCRYFYYA